MILKNMYFPIISSYVITGVQLSNFIFCPIPPMIRIVPVVSAYIINTNPPYCLVFSYIEMTTIQSFSTTILDPTEAIWPISAKMIVITGTISGNHLGQ